MELKPGAKLGPYEIQSPLGAGGMGEVYREHDTRLQRSVAIKVLKVHGDEDPLSPMGTSAAQKAWPAWLGLWCWDS